MSVNPMTYEAQFFGFMPQTCMLRIYTTFQDYLFEVMQAIEQVILKKLDGIPHCDISPVQIRKCTEKFLCFMKGHFDNLLAKWSNYKCKETPYSEEDFQQLQKEIEQLQEKYKTELCTKQALLAELEEQKIVQAKLKQRLTSFDELQNVGRDHGTYLVSVVQNSRNTTETLETSGGKRNRNDLKISYCSVVKRRSCKKSES
uniref:Protein MIS12 homolog n=1 Tax=Rhinopithecus bieti TaxID=61621 RepID=A0A2K6M236_RHIBE